MHHFVLNHQLIDRTEATSVAALTKTPSGLKDPEMASKGPNEHIMAAVIPHMKCYCAMNNIVRSNAAEL